MSKIVVFDKKRCPICKSLVYTGNLRCSGCDTEIRFININRIQNQNFIRRIAKYDFDGNIKEIYNNVYECYPIDSKEEQKKRTRVIKVCEGLSKRFDGFQWRYADDVERVDKISSCGSAKSVLQVDFTGKIMMEYQTVGEAKEKLHFTYSTISKACKRHIPPQDAEYFLFFSDDYCENVFVEAYRIYAEGQIKIEVRDSLNRLVGSFNSYKEVAKKFGVSATSISNWCKGYYNPSGEYEGYSFSVIGKNKKLSKKNNSCIKPRSEKCKLYIENDRLLKENEMLSEKILSLEYDFNELQKKYNTLMNEIESRKREYSIRKPKIDKRIRFMTPIEEFFNNKLYDIFAGIAIYVLCDESGKRYVGQTLRGDCTYKRIKEHFILKEGIWLNEWNVKSQFYIEQIVIGWQDDMPFNLDDAERYFIKYYDAYEIGHNKSQGNHREYAGKLDEEFIR